MEGPAPIHSRFPTSAMHLTSWYSLGSADGRDTFIGFRVSHVSLITGGRRGEGGGNEGGEKGGREGVGK